MSLCDIFNWICEDYDWLCDGCGACGKGDKPVCCPVCGEDEYIMSNTEW